MWNEDGEQERISTKCWVWIVSSGILGAIVLAVAIVHCVLCACK